ncbi:hypothetical protein [Argonema antarcticum]|nr:hypothetical protein [Argonema antarcticum A004/B2]
MRVTIPDGTVRGDRKVCGEKDNDLLYGDPGNDTICGGEGKDN